MHNSKPYLHLLKIPGLLPLLVAATLSRLAARMFALTMVLLALARYSSPTLAGWLTFAAVTPGILISPIAGAFLDRVGPTTALRIDMAAGAIFAVAISSGGWAFRFSPCVLFILVTSFSLTSPLGSGGTRALLPRLVPSPLLTQINAVDVAIYAIVDVVGPATAGLLVACLGTEPAMLLIAGAYVTAALCLSRVQCFPGLASTQTTFLRQTIEGVQMIAHHPTLRGLAFSSSMFEFTWGVISVVVPVSIARHCPPSAVSVATGLLWAAIGIAGVVGALLGGKMYISGRERGVMAAGMLVTSFLASLGAANLGFPVFAVFLVIAGLVAGTINVALVTLRQRRTDPQQLGRIISMSMSLNMAGFPLGAATAGMLIADHLWLTFVLAGVSSCLAALATASIPPEKSRQV